MNALARKVRWAAYAGSLALALASTGCAPSAGGGAAGDAGTTGAGGMSSGAGGSASGGSATGGRATGGSASGGSAAGGPATGGSASGGGTSGGAAGATGGTAAGGGAGGSATGGTATGGSATGGGAGGRGGAAGRGGAGGTATGGGAGTASAGSGGGASAGAGGSAPSAGCGVPNSLTSGRATITVSGVAREYILKLPDNYDANRRYKLVFAFHARGGNATQVAGSGNNDYYGLYARAGGSAVFVSPEGIDAGWRNSDGRDIAFVKAMLASFNSKLCIDQARIFSTGFSFGGMMSDAIGCAMADVFRAIAPMAGGLPSPGHEYSGCDQPNMHPIAVWMAHGDNDTVVPLADGKAALDLFVKRAGCQSQTTPVTPSPCVAYQGCMPEYPIHFCQFQGPHMVPSFAAQAIWTFFNQF